MLLIAAVAYLQLSTAPIATHGNYTILAGAIGRDGLECSTHVDYS